MKSEFANNKNINKMYKNLTTEDLKNIANLYAEDNWQEYICDEENEWNGHDLVGDNYIFQLSFWGSIRIFTKDSVNAIPLDYEYEDVLRKKLFSVGRQYISNLD